MFNKKGKSGKVLDKSQSPDQTRKTGAITLDALINSLDNMDDAEITEHRTAEDQPVTLVYIKTLIDQERLNESIIQPLKHCSSDTIDECMTTSKVSHINTLEEAQKQLMQGSIVLNNSKHKHWRAIQLKNPLSRGIQTSGTETVIYGAKDSFTEQIDNNITLLRRRLPLTELKTETFNVGYLSKTTVVLMYIEGLTNPEFHFYRQKKNIRY